MSNFEALKSYFDEVGRAPKAVYKDTRIGLFMRSSLTHVKYCLEVILKNGWIDTSKLFLDAGSGDGRIVALAALLGLPSIGIEFDSELATESLSHIKNLKKLSVINGNYTGISNGNFMHDDPYTSLGIRFNEIGTIFNYINNEEDIAAEIARQSPSGTNFLLYGPVTQRKFKGLKLEHELRAEGSTHFDRIYIYTK